MNQVSQLIDIAPQFKSQNAEVVFIFRETPPGQGPTEGIAGLQSFQQKSNPPFPIAIDFGARATSAYSAEGQFSTYVLNSDGKVAAELKGVKYIRPSAQSIAAAVANAY